jgi:hypothetical protein
MVVMTKRSGLFRGMALALFLIVGLGCSPADTALPLSSAEAADSLGGQALDALPAPLVGSSSLGLADSDGLGGFPAFLPPVAIGTDVQECQLGTDPYSTCI